MKISVMYVAMAPFISGSERCLQLILLNCTKFDIVPVLVVPPKSPLYSWAIANNIAAYQCNLSPFDKTRLDLWVVTQVKLIYLAIKYKIKVVHSNQIWSYPIIGFMSSLLNIKRICHFRDPINNGSKWWLKLKLHTAICVSEHIKFEYQRYINDGTSKYVKTMIDPVKYLPPKTVKQRKSDLKKSRNKLGLDVEVFLFGFIGQIAAVKGLYEFISLLGGIEEKNWKLIVAGKDPSESQEYIHRCKRLIKDLELENKVYFIGFLENTSDFYKAVNVVVMPSKEEPLGLIPLEAALFYKPAVVSDVGGLPETIIDKKTGWLINFSDAATVIKTLECVIDCDLEEIGQSARCYVENLAMPDIYIEKLKDIYLKD